jgi:hypothetical protein
MQKETTTSSVFIVKSQMLMTKSQHTRASLSTSQGQLAED